ncbi:MAG: DUF349 domain-containing protein [Bacteroidales bacterium]|nr:DUF349 domain-containing protein [Bacteroidales bacterium]MDD4216613.1 DUF349 domain-containing protein [Bacteroidales bacterium]MDY0141010.1 DUF349 domain-containing protein [Bacteroidales bacterium]
MSNELENKHDSLENEVEDKVINLENTDSEVKTEEPITEKIAVGEKNNVVFENTENDVPVETHTVNKNNEDDIFNEIETELNEDEIPDTAETGEEDYSLLTKEEILSKLKVLIHEGNIEESKKDIEILKGQYYKTQTAEYERLKEELIAQTGDTANFEMPKDSTEDYLKELLADYKKKKAEFAGSLEQEKEKNLQLKIEIIEKIKVLANSEESLNKTFAEFKDLQQNWLNIGHVPAAEATGLWRNYQLQIERFYDFVKINKELRDLDFKKNLEQKIELCEKAEELLLETDALASYKSLQELHNLWKELGPVPADKREEVWDRFSIISKKIRQAYQQYFEKLKEERNVNYEQKVILCEKAEEIANAVNPTTSKEWVEQTEKVMELQKIWKTIGMVPKEVNNEIYERFRVACNRFFNVKKEFYDVVNEELNINYQKKLEICVSAESLQDSTDWKKSTSVFLDLQKQWKTVGPVPRKYSDQIWKRFRAACNKFFDAKTVFYSSIEIEHKDNLQKKEDLIKEILEFKPLEDQTQNISKIKGFQAAWTEIGYVANSQKDRLYNEYRSAINNIYEKLNLSKNTIEVSNFNSKVEVLKETGELSGLQNERNKILKRIQEINLEINQYENNMGFFSSGSDSILKDFEKKINKAKDEVKTLKEKKKAVDLAEREITNKDKNKKDDQNN